jgi:hypothetical protein
LISSGEVVIVGGRGSVGELLDSIDLFDTLTGTLSRAETKCPQNTTTDLCCMRADHTATRLDDDNVLIWGGEIEAIAGGPNPPPQAEVFLLGDGGSLPACENAADLVQRTGHTATKIACRNTPCPVLIAGGIDDQSVLLAPALFEVTGSQHSGFFDGTVTGSGSEEFRHGHMAAALNDGTVLILGGLDESSESVGTAAVFSLCEAMGDLTCPEP